MEDRKKIAFYLEIGNQGGGVGNCLKAILDKLNCEDFKVYIYCNNKMFFDSIDNKKGLIFRNIAAIASLEWKMFNDNAKSLLLRMVQILWNKLPVNFRYLLYMIKKIFVLRNIYINDSIDIIHFQAGGFPKFCCALIGAKLAGISKIILTIHHPAKYRNKSLMVFRVMNRYALKVPHRIVAVSKSNAESLKEVDSKFNRQVQIIYNGIKVRDEIKIDQEQKKKIKESLGINQFVKVILIVTRLVPHKQVSIFVEIFKEILDSYPECYLCIVGEGDDSENIIKTIRRFSLDEKVKMLGRMENIDEIYAISDVFAFTSREEGFGLVIAEAMAHSIPVVAFDIGGVNEVIESNKTGYLVPLNEKEEFKTRLIDLLIDEHKARELGKNGRKRIRDLFNIDTMIFKNLELYK